MGSAQSARAAKGPHSSASIMMYVGATMHIHLNTCKCCANGFNAEPSESLAAGNRAAELLLFIVSTRGAGCILGRSPATRCCLLSDFPSMHERIVTYSLGAEWLGPSPVCQHQLLYKLSAPYVALWLQQTVSQAPHQCHKRDCEEQVLQGRAQHSRSILPHFFLHCLFSDARG